MRKFLTTIAVLVFLLSAVGVASASVLDCPQDYETWKITNTFPAGYQGLCSYYTRLPAESKAEFLSVGFFNAQGILGSYDLEDWKTDFAEDWTNGGTWYSRIIK